MRVLAMQAMGHEPGRRMVWMQQSPSAIVHARVMGILSTLLNPPAAQKQRIVGAVTPLLQSPSALGRAYARRVVRKLNLPRNPTLLRRRERNKGSRHRTSCRCGDNPAFVLG